MPNVSVNRDELFARLGENWGAKPGVQSDEADEAFDKLCFEYGIELDDVTSEKTMQEKETGAATNSAGTDILYVIAIPANRYDLLCLEGIVRSLRVFMGKEEPAVFKIAKPKDGSLQKMIVKPEVAQIRAVVVCAVLRNMTFNSTNYKSFIDLQEKLHANICRKRALVSIGTHDLDTIQGPFTYEALPPQQIKFAPLNNPKEYNGEELMKHLESDMHLKVFLPLIRDSPVYPVFFDKNRQVLSLPPIINSNHSKITLNTKNVLIEVTATDLTKAQIVLNTMCAMFAEYCEDKFSVEPVEICDSNGKVTMVTPDLTDRFVDADLQYITSGVGVNLEADNIVSLLHKMSLKSEITADKKSVKVSVPITRSDVIHACDIMEDVGIAYGYNNLERKAPATVTYAKQQILNKVTDFMRNEVAMTGFTEILTLSLCRKDECFSHLRRVDDGSAVVIANAVKDKKITEEKEIKTGIEDKAKTAKKANEEGSKYEICRTTLLAGLLKTVAHNKKAPLPLKIFEVSDIVMKSDKTDVGSINKRNLCAIVSDSTAQFGTIHGLLDRVMILNRVSWKEAGAAVASKSKSEHAQEDGGQYWLEKDSRDPAFFPGRGADVMLNGTKIGVIGVLHPEVLANYGINNPCSAFEICIESFV